MNRNGSIDGVLEAWFLDGPREMPDRVFEAVFDQVERVPQRRLARFLLRFSDMSSTAKWIAAGAAAVLAIGVGFAVLGRSPVTGPGTNPSPGETASPSPSAGHAELPAELRHAFLGPNRAVGSIAQGDRSILDFTEEGWAYFWNGQARLLPSQIGVEGDELVLTSDRDTGGCASGDLGRYRWSLSPGGSFLTLDAIADDCEPRSAAISDTWQRSVCRNTENFCLGILEPGTYSSMYVRPDLAPGADWTADFGAIRYTVPGGWANSADWPDHYALMRAASYAAGDSGSGAVAPDAITVLARPTAARLNSDCPEESEPGIGTTRAELGAWILAHPGLVVTQQPDVTVDGLPATVLDLAVADDWTETCDPNAPFVAAPVFFGGYHWALAQNDRMRVVLLDLPSGTTTAIVIDVQNPSSFETLVTETMPIVESFDFK
jgi:hypothetical protein